MLAAVYSLKNYSGITCKGSIPVGLWLWLPPAASPVLSPWDPAVLSPGTLVGSALILVWSANVQASGGWWEARSPL